MRRLQRHKLALATNYAISVLLLLAKRVGGELHLYDLFDVVLRRRLGRVFDDHHVRPPNKPGSWLVALAVLRLRAPILSDPSGYSPLTEWHSKPIALVLRSQLSPSRDIASSSDAPSGTGLEMCQVLDKTHGSSYRYPLPAGHSKFPRVGSIRQRDHRSERDSATKMTIDCHRHPACRPLAQ